MANGGDGSSEMDMPENAMDIAAAADDDEDDDEGSLSVGDLPGRLFAPERRRLLSSVSTLLRAVNSQRA